MAYNLETTTVSAKLLRGEISAVETFQQALEKFTGQTEGPVLAKIGMQHIEAVTILREEIVKGGGTPEDDSGIWGAFAKAIEGTAKVFGESAALTALIQGEEIGVSDYQAALENEKVEESLKSVIRGKLLPQLQENIIVLQALRS